MTMPVAYATRYDADAAREYLAAFGIATEMAEVPADDGRDGWVMWEVTIVELPARLVATARVVEERPSATTHPSVTEHDEYTKGTSAWDDVWERDQERRDYGH